MAKAEAVWLGWSQPHPPLPISLSRNSKRALNCSSNWGHLGLMRWPQKWNWLYLMLMQGIKLGNHYPGNEVLLLGCINHKAKWCGSSVSKTWWKWGWAWGTSAYFSRRRRVLCLFCFFSWVVLGLFCYKFLFWSWAACLRRTYFCRSWDGNHNSVFQEVTLFTCCMLLNAHAYLFCLNNDNRCTLALLKTCLSYFISSLVASLQNITA